MAAADRSTSPIRAPTILPSALPRRRAEAQFPLNDDFNGARQEGLGLYQVTQINGERCSAARAYLRPHIGKRPNLRVETHARALRLLFDGKRAIGAESSSAASSGRCGRGARRSFRSAPSARRNS